MRKLKKDKDMLSREKLLPPTRQASVVFLSDDEIRNKFKDVDFFASKNISLPKK